MEYYLFSSIVDAQDRADLAHAREAFGELLRAKGPDLGRFGLRQLGFVFILLPEGQSNPHHANKAFAIRPQADGGQPVATLQRHLDYPRFMGAAPQERLALMAQTFLDGILELPKARGLKRLDAKVLHEALRQTLEAEGLLVSVENI